MTEGENVIGSKKDDVVDVDRGLRSSAEVNLKKCPCTNHDPDSCYVICSVCSQEWHQACVGLQGLTEPMVKLLDLWLCPICFILPQKVIQKSGIINIGHSRTPVKGPRVESSANCTTIRLIVQEELQKVKSELNQTVQGAVTESITENMEKIETSVRSYATVAAENHTGILQELETVKNQKPQAQTPTDEVMKKVVTQMDIDQYERNKRKANLMINKIPEADSEDMSVKNAADMKFLVEKLKIPEYDIVTCYRAGYQKTGEDGKQIPRPLIVKMRDVPCAQKWHDYERGTKITLGAVDYYINADLCKADRQARFFARDQRRKIKEKSVGTSSADS